MLKKLLSFVLVNVMMVCCIAVPTSAEAIVDKDTSISPMNLYSQSIKSYLSISSKTASCKSTVIGISGKTTKIVITQRLQKKNGSSWTNIQSWTKTYTQVSAVYCNTKSGLTSGTYRTRTIAKIYKDTAYETIRVNSATDSI